MTRDKFNQLLANWETRTDSIEFQGKVLVAWRELFLKQAEQHPDDAIRTLFRQAAALPVITGKIARNLCPFVNCQ